MEKNDTVVIQKTDLTEYALSLGIWNALIGGLPKDTEEVEITAVRKVA